MFIYLIKLLIMISYVFIFLLVQSFAFSQITDVNININSRNIKNNKNQYLEKLKNDIEFYLLSNNFLETTNENIKFSIDINIILESISDNDVVSAHVIFSNRKDQLLLSDGIDFEYKLGQNLIYTTTYNPLASFLNYNIFIILANELDKYSYKGGENYYIRSEDIAFQATISDYPRRWNKRLKHIKQVKDNLYLRNIKHLYHKINIYLNNSDDEFDDNDIVEILEEIYDELININDNYGHHKNTILFLNANIIELLDLYYDYEMSYVIKFLQNYDKDNADVYNDYID